MSNEPTETPAGGTSAEDVSKEQEIFNARLKKAEDLRAQGLNPYRNGWEPDHTTGVIAKELGELKAQEEVEKASQTYAVAGRILANRTFGKAAFLKLRDREGDLQVWAKKDVLGDQAFETYKLADLGDIVAAKGKCTRTKTGELTLVATEFHILTKSLRPLPEKWHGLSDIETRCRQRYLDLIVTPGVKDLFVKRHRIVRGIQRFLDGHGFIEVETPTLHKPEEAGGATARPFQTHHNALDMDLKLRIALELHLKRLVVGGIDRVYEIGRIWRNEGIDRRHNPEFTMVEFYQAYATWQDLMKLTEDLLLCLATDVTGSAKITYQGQVIDFTPPYPRISMVEHTASKLGLQASAALAGDGLKQACERAAREAHDKDLAAILDHAATMATPGEMIARAFEAVGEPQLPKDRPVFVTDFPIEVSPLARKRDADPRVTDRFELFAAGMEIANAFSELNDPVDQRARFQRQVELARKGDQEAMPYDEDFVRALEHGMPPTAGEGIGIDRLTMLLTDSASIRDVVLFPLLKPVK
ncbi:MAG: lysine--tRNA ligase [Deltaproteobacteria bacterium]|nr:lysine--tRNA ligase [Deltaproteobacteria bacterium]